MPMPFVRRRCRVGHVSPTYALRRRLALLLALLPALVILPAWAAVPFWGARQSSDVDTPPAQLKPGQWIWGGDSKALGPMAVVVSLTEQRAYAYRNGILVGVATISSGRKGYETPTGVFTILQKDKDHRSNEYDNAPMPYQQRLTWGGVALHAGGVPGYPESHGCVHLPTAFAQKLFEASNMGMTVVVSEDGKAPVDLVHPGPISPVDPAGNRVDLLLEDGRPWRWEPERAPGDGPISIVFSRSDRILFVYRGGIEIGRSRIALDEPHPYTGTRVYIVADGYVPPADATAAATAPLPAWVSIGVPGHEDQAGQRFDPAQANQITLPPAFRAQVLPLLRPGTVVVATDARILPDTTGLPLQVLDSEPPDTPR